VRSPYRFYFKQLTTKLIAVGRGELFKDDRAAPDSSIVLDDVVERLVIAGSVESVVDQILAFREEVGDFGTLIYAGHDWLDAGHSRRSMELMAGAVMPAINRAIATSTAVR
jgi:alkanesulfonate monooxygenase SsuD/methylene tetrahydromethanopterin reductase-like flavin-dependent oxidoreductase (luciferase family)